MYPLLECILTHQIPDLLHLIGMFMGSETKSARDAEQEPIPNNSVAVGLEAVLSAVSVCCVGCCKDAQSLLLACAVNAIGHNSGANEAFREP